MSDTVTSSIAYLINQYPQPSHTFIRREIRALEAAGWNVERFTLRRFNQPLADAADRDEQQRTRAVLDAGPIALGVALLSRAVTQPVRFWNALRATLRLSGRSRRGLLAHLAYLAEACLLYRWFDTAGIAHVHVHFGTNSAAAAMLCRLLGGPPYSFTLHGPKEFDEPWALSLDEKIRHASFVVAITNFCRSQLFRWSAFEDWPKIEVVHCGVDSAFLNVEPSRPPTVPRLVCVGRLVEQKGPLILVEAVEELRRRGFECEVVMVGDGPMRPALEHRIADRGLGKHVRLLGTLDGQGVRREILGSRAMVLPSFAEGLPVVLMEALALGRPVIATYIAGVPELVRQGREGWLVPAGSAHSLADAMAEALTADSADLLRMGCSGAERVAERHDAETQAHRLGTFIATRLGFDSLDLNPPAQNHDQSTMIQSEFLNPATETKLR